MFTWGSGGEGANRSGDAVLSIVAVAPITVASSLLKKDVTASPASDRIEVMDENREVWLSIFSLLRTKDDFQTNFGFVYMF